jgi:hypothetical protein
MTTPDPAVLPAHASCEIFQFQEQFVPTALEFLERP